MTPPIYLYPLTLWFQHEVLCDSLFIELAIIATGLTGSFNIGLKLESFHLSYFPSPTNLQESRATWLSG